MTYDLSHKAYDQGHKIDNHGLKKNSGILTIIFVELAYIYLLNAFLHY